jgi:hypothetical protein
MIDSHLHYMAEKQRHEMERRQAREYWLRHQLLGIRVAKDNSLDRSLRLLLAARPSQLWWKSIGHRFRLFENCQVE